MQPAEIGLNDEQSPMEMFNVRRVSKILIVDHYDLLAWTFNAVVILGISNGLGLLYLIWKLRQVTKEDEADKDEALDY